MKMIILCSISVLSLVSHAEEAGNSLVQAKRVRFIPSLNDGDKAILEGRKAYQKRDYFKAAEHYKDAVSKLPPGPIAEEKRRLYTSYLIDRLLALSIQKRKQGEDKESRKLLIKALKLVVE